MILSSSTKNKAIAIGIIATIIIFLGLPFTEWWFTGDDFHGVFLGWKTKNWSDLFYFFYEGNTNQGAGVPGGYVTSRPNFLGAYYRPLYCIYLALQYWCFSTNGYGYFLCNIAMHALAAGLIFYLFSKFASRWTAALAAALFAVHPQIAYRFGAVVNFHYYVNVVLILSIALLLLSYIKSKKIIFLTSALFCYALSLCTRETTLVLPGIIAMLLFSYFYSTKQAIPWKKIIKITLLFSAIAAAFLLLRLWLYPLGNATPNGNFLPYVLKGSFVKTKFQEFLVFFYDLLFMSWLPWGNKILKLILLIPLLSLLNYSFWTCRQKILTIAFFISGLLMLWPGLISFYSPRYIYESMPFFLACFTALFATTNLKSAFKKMLKIFISLYALTLSIFVFISFKAREKKLHTMHTAANALCKELSNTNRPLCFLTTPSDGFSGGYNPQIFWILFNNRDYPIYFDSALAITQKDSNIVKPTWLYNEIAPFYKENFVLITAIEKGFELKSLDYSKIEFEEYHQSRPQQFGLLNILSHNESLAITHLRLIIFPSIWNQKPLFINWNYKTKKFEVIDRFKF